MRAGVLAFILLLLIHVAPSRASAPALQDSMSVLDDMLACYYGNTTICKMMGEYAHLRKFGGTGVIGSFLAAHSYLQLRMAVLVYRFTAQAEALSGSILSSNESGYLKGLLKDWSTPDGKAKLLGEARLALQNLTSSVEKANLARKAQGLPLLVLDADSFLSDLNSGKPVRLKSVIDGLTIKVGNVAVSYDQRPQWMRAAAAKDSSATAAMIFQFGREFVKGNPQALANAIDALAALEHERYLVETRKAFVAQALTLDREILLDEFAKANNLTPEAARKIRPSAKDLAPFAEKRISHYKPNWPELDKPYAQLSEAFKIKNRDIVRPHLEKILNSGFFRSSLVANHLKTAKSSLILTKDQILKRMSRAGGVGFNIAGWALLTYDAAQLYHNWHSISEAAIQMSNRTWAEGAIDLIVDPENKCRLKNENPLDRFGVLVCGCKDKSGFSLDRLDCEIFKNHDDNCRITEDSFSQMAALFMKEVESKGQLKNLAQKCPDVTQNWQAVATNVMEQVASIKQSFNEKLQSGEMVVSCLQLKENPSQKYAEVLVKGTSFIQSQYLIEYESSKGNQLQSIFEGIKNEAFGRVCKTPWVWQNAYHFEDGFLDKIGIGEPYMLYGKQCKEGQKFSLKPVGEINLPSKQVFNRINLGCEKGQCNRTLKMATEIFASELGDKHTYALSKFFEVYYLSELAMNHCTKSDPDHSSQLLINEKLVEYLGKKH